MVCDIAHPLFSPDQPLLRRGVVAVDRESRMWTTTNAVPRGEALTPLDELDLTAW